MTLEKLYNCKSTWICVLTQKVTEFRKQNFKQNNKRLQHDDKINTMVKLIYQNSYFGFTFQKPLICKWFLEGETEIFVLSSMPEIAFSKTADILS